MSLEDVRGNAIDIENLQFAQVEMLNSLGEKVNSFRQGATTSDDLAYELGRTFDSMLYLGLLTDSKLKEACEQLDVLTGKNARGLKI